MTLHGWLQRSPRGNSHEHQDRNRRGRSIYHADCAAAIASAAVVFTTDLSPLRQPANIENECSINGLGSGTCTFHNIGGKKGNACVVAAVVIKRTGSDAGMAKVCPGNLKPGGVSQITFFVSGMDACKDGVLNWQSICHLILR